MKLDIHLTCNDFNSFRAAKVKSLFNASSGHEFRITADIDIESFEWGIGLIVGKSGSGKTTIGQRMFPGVEIYNQDYGWDNDKPIIDCISPGGDFDSVTASLAAVGLGDVPAWLRPYSALSNGQKFRASLARLICEMPDVSIVDEFTSVVDRHIAKIGAQAFSKSWKRNANGKKVVLLSCHYDIIEWLQPDWVFNTDSMTLTRGAERRPKFELEIYRTNQSFWKLFKPHYYLDLPMPVGAQCFVGFVGAEPVCHLVISPRFEIRGYRATRLVVMPEWQGAGVGTKFLESICELHKNGGGLHGRKFPTYFHTSHPQMVSYLRRSSKWSQVSAVLFGGNKNKSARSLSKSGCAASGYGGHTRAVQGFKYIGGK